MDPQFIDWAFKALITGAVIYGVRVLSKLQESVEELNIRVAVVVQQVTGHEKELDKHSERLQKLETCHGENS